MVIDQKLTGKKYPPLTYEIGREKLKEFIASVKADESKFAEIVHPTFPVVYGGGLLWSVLFDTQLKLNLSKLVHGEQEFIYHKPVRVGDVITTEAHIEKIFQKGPHDFVVLVSHSRNQLGEKVCDSIWTFIIRGGNDSDFTLQEKLMMKIASILPANPKDKSGQMHAMQELVNKTGKAINLNSAKQDLYSYEEISATESLYKVFIDKYMPQVYAGASGDFNIIHLDENFGRSVGLGGNILHGMATMALGANFAMHSHKADQAKRYKARFSSPVKPLDTISFKGAWSGKEFKFVAINQNGQEVINLGLFEIF